MQIQSFALPIEYKPTKSYNRRELIELLRRHSSVLCYAAFRLNVISNDTTDSTTFLNLRKVLMR